MAKQDGGPAFPWWEDEWGESDGEATTIRRPRLGMSLRDYFAGQCLANIAVHARHDRTDRELAEMYAQRCYLMADAMIAERDKD